MPSPGRRRRQGRCEVTSDDSRLDEDSLQIHLQLLRIRFATALTILIRLREKEMLTKDRSIEKLEVLARFGRYTKEIVAGARAQLEVS